MDWRFDFKAATERLRQLHELEHAPRLTAAISGQLAEKSWVRRILPPTTQTAWKLEDPETLQDQPVWLLPTVGRPAMSFFEFMAEEAVIPLFTVAVGRDWLIRYNEREDIVARAIKETARILAEYESEIFWTSVRVAAATSTECAGIVPDRPAQIYQMPDGDCRSGYFSKELINRMLVGAQRSGRTLVKLLISPEDAADIREYSDIDVDPETRAMIFQAAGLDKIWNIELEVCEDLGVRGRFCIQEDLAEYRVLHPNQQTPEKLLCAGETQVYGLTDRFVDHTHLVSKGFDACWDYDLRRRGKFGFYGTAQYGFGMFGSEVLMGIVDRYVPGQ